MAGQKGLKNQDGSKKRVKTRCKKKGGVKDVKRLKCHNIRKKEVKVSQHKQKRG